MTVSRRVVGLLWSSLLAATTASVVLGAAGHPAAQAGAERPPAAPAAVPRALTPKAAAPIDLTGYWVSVVTEDWRWRMVTPARNDFASLPMTREAEAVGNAWDPAKDEAAGEQCKSYGAPALMHVPGRLHITWQDESTLKVETDAGTQVRVFHFGAWTPPAGEPTWQGDSVAEWETPEPPANAPPPRPGAGPAKFGNLKVVTTHLRPGYIRKNGAPYSANAVLTEYWDLNVEDNGERWLVVTSIVHDPQYLRMDWITSPNFKGEPTGAKWDPSPCSSFW
jgi:hypothetical protein